MATERDAANGRLAREYSETEEKIKECRRELRSDAEQLKQASEALNGLSNVEGVETAQTRILGTANDLVGHAKGQLRDLHGALESKATMESDLRQAGMSGLIQIPPKEVPGISLPEFRR